MLFIALKASIFLHITVSMLSLQYMKRFTPLFVSQCVKGGSRRSASSGHEGSSTLAERVYHALTTTCGVSSNTCLLLSVSGGVDSMAMLHLVSEIKQKYAPGLTVEVLNFNHKLRPLASEKERELVETWSKRYEFTFHCVERTTQKPSGVRVYKRRHENGDKKRQSLFSILTASAVRNLI